MTSNNKETYITERLLVGKLKEKDYSKYICKCIIFFVIIVGDLILT